MNSEKMAYGSIGAAEGPLPLYRTRVLIVVSHLILYPYGSYLNLASYYLVYAALNILFCLGSCYAFATVGAIEGINYKETKRLIKLSEQQIIDGSNINNLGCDGGYLVESFEYAIKAGVVPAKCRYPRTGVPPLAVSRQEPRSYP